MKVIHTNLQLTYPHLSQDAHDKLARQTIKNQMLNTAASIKSWAMSPTWAVQQIRTVHNQQVLTEALENPNGMLAIVPHLGAWEMMNAWLNQFGSPTIMYKPLKNALQNDFILQGRQRLNATLVPTDSSGVKAIFKTLKNGGFSIILPDHVPDPSGGVVVPFFGIPTLTSTLAPKLAQKTKCALVGLTCIRRDDGDGFDVYCEKLDNPDLYHPDINVATCALNLAIEQMISRFPSQYMWGYKRFKQVPDFDAIYQADADIIAKIHAQYPK